MGGHFSQHQPEPKYRRKTASETQNLNYKQTQIWLKDFNALKINITKEGYCKGETFFAQVTSSLQRENGAFCLHRGGDGIFFTSASKVLQIIALRE